MSNIYWVKDLVPRITLSGFVVSTKDIPNELWCQFDIDHGFWSTGWTETDFKTILGDPKKIKIYLPLEETNYGGAGRPRHDVECVMAYLPKEYAKYFDTKNEWGDIFP